MACNIIIFVVARISVLVHMIFPLQLDIFPRTSQETGSLTLHHFLSIFYVPLILLMSSCLFYFTQQSFLYPVLLIYRWKHHLFGITFWNIQAHTHTHLHSYRCMYACACMRICVCLFLCIFLCMSTGISF